MDFPLYIYISIDKPPIQIWNISQVPLHLRQSWFEELLRLRRRRARFLWLDTPLAKLFTPQDDSAQRRRDGCGVEALMV